MLMKVMRAKENQTITSVIVETTGTGTNAANVTIDQLSQLLQQMLQMQLQDKTEQRRKTNETTTSTSSTAD